MRAIRLQTALERLVSAIRDLESELSAMNAEHDPLASHIFVYSDDLECFCAADQRDGDLETMGTSEYFARHYPVTGVRA
jgi:hypothetical protein